MKKGIVLVTAMMLFSTGMACAEVGVDVDVTWVSKYIWRGFDKTDDKAAFQPSVNFNLGNGFSANVFSSQPGSSKGAAAVSNVDAEELFYTVTYSNSLWDGEVYAANYALNWIYYNWPDRGRKDADMQEFLIAVAWPDICPMGVVPSYVFARCWAAEGGGLAADNGGFAHVFGLNYDLAVAELPNPLDLGFQLVYNDGCGDQTVDHDWSHIVWSVKTSFDCGAGRLSPGVYYQTSMEDTVNPEDEFWCGISYGFSF
jgi:uncharacterized protein (TIGR02001 family)